MLDLFTATLLTALIVLATGGDLYWNGPPLRKNAVAFLRSKPATVGVFGTAAAWFLWHVAHLGEADFGNIREILFIGFAAIGILSFFHVRDFLVVRGLAILGLLSANVLLDAAYMHYESPQRLVLVVLVYALIIASLYLGAVPYRLRDFFSWLWARGRAKRPRFLALGLIVYGLLLTITALTY